MARLPTSLQLVIAILAALRLTITTSTDLPLRPRLIHEFPNGTYVHSIAVRKRNSDVLATISTAPEVYLVPTNGSPPVKVSTLPNVQAVTGIVEVCDDEFYIAGGNLSISQATSEFGSYSIWRLKLRDAHRPGDYVHDLVHIADFPDARLLSRITQLHSEMLLVTDSILGAIWSLNLHTKQSKILYQHASMAPISPMGVGVNAAKAADNYLYFGNSEKALLVKVPINPRTGETQGAYEVIYKNKRTIYPQGFNVRGRKLWLASGFNNVDVFALIDDGPARLQVAVAAPSTIEVFARKNSLQSAALPAEDLSLMEAFAGTSDVQFGSSPQDLVKGRMYISTVGRSNHEWVAGGAIWAVDTGISG